MKYITHLNFRAMEYCIFEFYLNANHMNSVYLKSDSFQIILSCILLIWILLCKLSIRYNHRCNNRNVLFFSWLWYIFSISYNALDYNTLVPKDMNISSLVENIVYGTRKVKVWDFISFQMLYFYLCNRKN